MAGGGYNTASGIMDEVAQERDPKLQQTRTYYDPYANENDNNTSSGLAAFGEGIGTASGYRSPGYAVNRDAGYVGGSQQASDANVTRLNRRYDEAQQAGAPFKGQYVQGVQDAAASRQQQLAGLGMTADAAGMYRSMAMGNGPSLAQLQMQQGLQAAQAQQASAAAGARGGGANLAAAQLSASTMAGQQAAANNEAAGRARVQEQLGAMQGYGGLAGQYGGLAGQMRGQDYQNAGMGMQGYQYQQGLAQNYDQMRQQQDLAELNAQTSLEQAQGQLALQRQQQLAQQNQASASEGSSIFGGLLGGLKGIF